MDFLNPVDVHVGARVSASRVFRNFQIWELASAIKIPATRLIEYETGKARCTAEHLTAIAHTLNVRSTFFFDGLRKKATRTQLNIWTKMPEIKLALNDNVARPDEKKSL